MFETSQSAINLMPTIFVWMLGIIFVIVVVTFIYDIVQSKNAILRNYPVVGHFRYLFSTLGEFFRQYFFAMDREEMPFNRAERAWIERASKGKDNTIAFGSTKNLTTPGTAIFINCPFPTLDSDAIKTKQLLIGEHCNNPYMAKSIFNISGMSFGAISKPAVLALANGARMAQCWINTGEGGLSPYHLESGADLVFQIGTAKYGVRNDDGSLNEDKLQAIAQHEQVKMFELKISQGAKPGKGGILPGVKVTKHIAKIRGIPQGEDSISPNRHPEIANATQLLNMIERVKKITQKPVGFKTVIGRIEWLESLLQEINKRGLDSAPDFITVDGGDGGTGAAPMALMDSMGLPIKEALPLVVDKIKQYNLAGRMRIIASGKMITPSDVAWAICTGAEFVTSARGFMFAIGCIQSLKCNKNTCPTGITTHNKRLQKGLSPKSKAKKVQSYILEMRKTVDIIAHSCGVKEVRGLNRTHVRIVQNNTRSIPMDELYQQTTGENYEGV
jgi:glutamate synthase domain-containing protein 2